MPKPVRWDTGTLMFRFNLGQTSPAARAITKSAKRRTAKRARESKALRYGSAEVTSGALGCAETVAGTRLTDPSSPHTSATHPKSASKLCATGSTAIRCCRLAATSRQIMSASSLVLRAQRTRRLRNSETPASTNGSVR